MMYSREDWKLFRGIGTIGQKAGVTTENLPRLVVKELVDNALDASGTCRVGLTEGGGFYVEDDGDGIPGDNTEIASMFSIARPLSSTKLIRLPSRGAMGNGLRVVAGSILASAGRLTVSTRGRSLALSPRDDGGTTVEQAVPTDRPATRIEIHFGPTLRVDSSTLAWGREAIRLASGSPRYSGRTSALWYDGDSFFDLLDAAGERTVWEVVQGFDGCTGRKGADIVKAFGKGSLACELGRRNAASLLAAMRVEAKPFNPKRLGTVGPIEGFPCGYSVQYGSFVPKSRRSDQAAEIPFAVEVWSETADRPSVRVAVNRTPIAAEISAYHEKGELSLFGCGLQSRMNVRGRKPVRAWVNIDTPFMPIVTDGKSPDLSVVVNAIDTALVAATRRARRSLAAWGPTAGPTQKDVILRHLDEAIAKASEGGDYRFSLRQLFYAVRPFMIARFDKEPEYDYFCSVITGYENEQGRDIPGMYRDSRGTLYHPHTGEEIALGTLSAEQYRRPSWRFNKILYCEKEGFFPILKDSKWPERHDCALMTSKGFASRAARDVLDQLGDGDEEIEFYCVHDADASGTMIYQSLQEATKARPGRKVKIINLGLDPVEAVAMKLQVETVHRKGDKGVSVATYVEEPWRAWLQSKRVELNAMTTPEFLAWLDRKFEAATGKVVPPGPVLRSQVETDVREHLRDRIVADALRKARVDGKIDRAVRDRREMIDGRLEAIESAVRFGVESEPNFLWTEWVNREAKIIAADAPT